MNGLPSRVSSSDWNIRHPYPGTTSDPCLSSTYPLNTASCLSPSCSSRLVPALPSSTSLSPFGRYPSFLLSPGGPGEGGWAQSYRQQVHVNHSPTSYQISALSLQPSCCAEPRGAHTVCQPTPHSVAEHRAECTGGCPKLMRVLTGGWTLLTLSRATAPRCCGTWQSVVWRGQVQRLWQKAWQWCEGPKACLRTAQRREPRS